MAVDQFVDGTGTKTVWTFADAAGSVRSMGRVDAAKVWTIAHRSFDENGQTQPFRNEHGSVIVSPSDLLGAHDDAFLTAVPTIWAGHQFDNESGLYDMKARWYDPLSHRFLTEDPAKADTNLYRYGAGDPVNNIDPDGRIVVSGPLLIGTAIFFGGGLLVGGAHGFAETVAANPNATGLELGVGTTLGGAFGLINPFGEFVSAGGAIVGGGIELAGGGNFLGTGFQAGGLVAGIAGGFGSFARKGGQYTIGLATRRTAAIGVGVEFAGAGIGGAIGFAETGTLEGSLHRAQQGVFVTGIARGATGLSRYGVDPATRAADEAAGVLVNGRYIKNPTAKNLNSLLTANGKIGGKQMSGRYMYVVDDAGNITIGTRAGQRMPHPTLIGGANPQVRGAGIVDIRGGRIFSVDNASGHFKPGAGSLDAASDAFGKLPDSAFHRNFQGFVPFNR